VRGFDGHKLVRGRKRHILVDTLGLIIASRVEPAGISDQRAGTRLLGGLRPFFPAIRTVMADAGTRAANSHVRSSGTRAGGWSLPNAASARSKSQA
jgi:Transposase DDE domain